MLTGIGPDGRPLRVELDAATLATSGDGYCIGRHPELVDTAIDDERVSRRHARFTSDGATIHVEDLNSTAGTMVNRNPIDPFAPARLQPGDKVVLGGLELVASQR
jgi:pSer/pThr/pTyr-binding forkhead associated (FHA) protein